MYRQDATVDRSLLVTAFRGKVFAVDRITGEVKWKCPLHEWEGGVVELHVGDVIVAASATRLAFVRYATGELLKNVDRSKHEKTIGRRATLLIDGDQLFLTGTGTVACYTLNGDFVWEQYFTGEGMDETAIGFPGNVRQADDRGAK